MTSKPIVPKRAGLGPNPNPTDFTILRRRPGHRRLVLPFPATFCLPRLLQELLVETFLCHQFVVRTGFQHLAIVHYDYRITMPNRRQSVGDRNRDPVGLLGTWWRGVRYVHLSLSMRNFSTDTLHNEPSTTSCACSHDS